MDKIDFLKKLNLSVYQRKGNQPFKLEDVIHDSSLLNKYQKDIDQLVGQNFFLEKADNNTYQKTYRIFEVCKRTIKELEKEDINLDVIFMLKNNPMLLHYEFRRWLETKHNSMISYILDKYWHNFLLYSKEYNSWCYDHFNRFIFHRPTPNYEKEALSHNDILRDNIDFFKVYLNQNPSTKSILLYNLPYKLFQRGNNLKKIKHVLFDLAFQKSYTKQSENKVSSILKKLEHDIKSKGFYFIENKYLTLDEFDYLNEELGTIISRTDICVQKDSKRLFNSFQKMPLHTDIYDADIISWFCEKQDEKYGNIILKDLRSSLKKLNKSEVEILKTIHIRCPMYKKFVTEEYPLVDNEKIYYVPWLEKNTYTEKQKKVFNKFKALIDKEKEIIIKLQKGDMLFVNNSFIVHGRDAITKNSQRLLRRTHIMR